MTWQVVTIDRTTLPEALLPLAKSQSRIDFTRDDAYLTELAGQALDDIERHANANFFDCTISGAWDARYWTPWFRPPVGLPPGVLWSATAGYGLVLPFNNVRTLSAADGEGNDVTSTYSFTQSDPGGVGTAILWGPLPPQPGAPVTFTFACGVTDLADLAPSVRRAVLRRCAALYENREAPLVVDEVSELALWRPSV